MGMKNALIEYINEKYAPEAIIVYGSYADGSFGAHSDFDALVIAPGACRHDTSIVAGTPLDVFVYPPEAFDGEFEPSDFVQTFDGNIVLDKNGAAQRLQARVRAYLDQLLRKTSEELRGELDWCRKMLSRASRGDAEGFYRWHWLLSDSLEIYCDMVGERYFGPKKALRRMECRDPEGFGRYFRALSEFSQPALADWIDYLEMRAETN